jgi:chemotaxis protein methyltransferase CheR
VTTTTALLAPELSAALLDLVKCHFGLHSSDYQASRLADVVADLLPAARCRDGWTLYSMLASGSRPDLLQELAGQLTVGETYFFRGAAQIDALRKAVLPELVERRSISRRLRMWSAGCSTGEEPYTLAMLVRDFVPRLSEWNVQIVGTDISRAAVDAASKAEYPSWSFRGRVELARQRYFEPVGKAWRLVEPVRRMVQFACLNLAAAELVPPLREVDLLLCRNVTIYFGPQTTQRLYQHLAAALAPGGWLVLGASDPAPEQPSRLELEPVYLDGAVLWRRAIAPRAAGRPPGHARRPAASGARRHDTHDELLNPSSARGKDPAITPAGTCLARDPSQAQGFTAGQGFTAEQAEGHLLAGFVSMEAGDAAAALEQLRQATFLDPRNPLGQFALAQAHLCLGDTPRAHVALVQARRLLAGRLALDLVDGAEGMTIEMLRQAVDTLLMQANTEKAHS